MTDIIDPQRREKALAENQPKISEVGSLLSWFERMLVRGATSGLLGCFGLLGASGVSPKIAALIAGPLTLFALSLAIFFIRQLAMAADSSTNLYREIDKRAPEQFDGMPRWTKILLSTEVALGTFISALLSVAWLLFVVGFAWTVVAVWLIAA